MVMFLGLVRRAWQFRSGRRLEAVVEKEGDGFKKELERRIVEELKNFEKRGKNKALLKWLAKAGEKIRACRVCGGGSTNYDFRVESAYLNKGLDSLDAKAKGVYYKLGSKSRENSAKAGNSYASYTSQHESAVLKEAQKLQQEAKSCHQQNKIHITIDCRQKEARDAVKLFSPATWRFMYEMSGRIEFN